MTKSKNSKLFLGTSMQPVTTNVIIDFKIYPLCYFVTETLPGMISSSTQIV